MLRPILPFLHFAKRNTENENNVNHRCLLDSLPPELTAHSLLSFSNWGDLAKLENVRSDYKNLVASAAEYGGPESTWDLAQSLLNGQNGLRCNPSLGVKYLQKLAEKNDKVFFSRAAGRLASCHFHGEGTTACPLQGMRWLKAAAKTDLDAAHEVANIYEHGKYGVDVDVVEAAQWYLNAALRGHPEAMAEYALCLELGCGVDQDDEKALEWYVAAATAGNVESNYSVGEA